MVSGEMVMVPFVLEQLDMLDLYSVRSQKSKCRRIDPLGHIIITYSFAGR